MGRAEAGQAEPSVAGPLASTVVAGVERMMSHDEHTSMSDQAWEDARLYAQSPQEQAVIACLFLTYYSKGYKQCTRDTREILADFKERTRL